MIRIRRHLSLVMLLLTASASLAETIRVGAVEYPPHVNFKKNQTDIKAFRYVEKVLKGIYLNVEFIRFPSKRALAELKQGNIDLLFPLDGIQKDVKHLSQPLFHTVPGLCFNKKDFIPILSATHLLKGLNIGVPAGTEVIDGLKNAGVALPIVEGSNTLDRGIQLLLGKRIDAFYHPSPVQIYHHSNPLSKSVACSYFYGYSSGVYIAVKPKMSANQYRLIDTAFSTELKIKSYEYYFAERH